MASESIMHKGKGCYICGKWGTDYEPLERHHCLHGTSNRKNAEKYGLVVYLCSKHHRGSREGAHGNRKVDIYLIEQAQKAFEEKIGTREQFMEIFGKNYLM